MVLFQWRDISIQKLGWTHCFLVKTAYWNECQFGSENLAIKWTPK